MKKKYVKGTDVCQAALARIDELYDRVDTVAVSFSGGKDSTVAFQLALEVATARKKLPLKMYFFDEEAIHPETIEYMHRVNERDDIDLLWLCLPVKHRNACSRRQPWWYPWHPDDRAKWVREMPKMGITTHPDFRDGVTANDFYSRIYGKEHGTVGLIRGLRADESLLRMRTVSRSAVDNWIGGPPGKCAKNSHVRVASPIYDWATPDVWHAPKHFGWDYNRTYDVFHKAGVAPHAQRVCPPYGEEPLGSLHQYAVCWPHLWHKMIARVNGAATAARYARTELYGFGGRSTPPPGKTWKSWFWDLLSKYPAEERVIMTTALQTFIGCHDDQTFQRPIPEETPDDISGASWKGLCAIAMRGDLKNRRKNVMRGKAQAMQEKQGITYEQAIERARHASRNRESARLAGSVG